MRSRAGVRTAARKSHAGKGIEAVRRSRWSVGGAAVLLLVPLAASRAVAAEAWPALSAEVSVELQDDYGFHASDPPRHLNDLYLTLEGEFALAYEGGSGLFAKLVFEPVMDTSDDRYFSDMGLYAEELYLAWRGDGVGLRVGKQDLPFGLANDLAPDLYGDDLVGEYELTELLAVAFEAPLLMLGGEHVATAALVMADRTILGDSLFTKRGRLRRRDGGVANTRHPASFVLSLAGTIEDTGYALGVRYLGAGRGDGTAEIGAVAGLKQTLERAGLEITVFGEFAYFPDFDGARTAAAFSSFGVEVGVGDVVLAAMHGLQGTENESLDQTVGVSVGWELSEGVSLAAGYRFLDQAGVDSHTLGLLLRYEFGLD